MSTREKAQIIFNNLTDEQLEGFVTLFQNLVIPEPPNTAHSAAEIDAMLEEAEEDVRAGRVCSWEEIERELNTVDS